MSREWSDEENETLRTMWDGGASASQIARKLPADRTRSAVLGRVHRLKLASRPQMVAKKDKVQPRDPGVLRLVVSKPKKPESAPTITDDPGPMAPPIATLELRDHHCRWPYDTPDGNYHYCGQSPKSGSPWCEHHFRKAHQPKASAA